MTHPKHLVLLIALVIGLVTLPALSALPKLPYQEGLTRACFFSHYVERGETWVKLDLSEKVTRNPEATAFGKGCPSARVRVMPKGDDKVIAEATIPMRDGVSGDVCLKTPGLDGEYRIEFLLQGASKQETVTRNFERKKYPWEGNTLGITDEVFAPFEPVKKEGPNVYVVGRKYTMNGFGLWDHVVSMGREMLASRMTIRFTSGGIEGKWLAKQITPVSVSDKAAVYRARATSGAVCIDTTSTTEFDGCMKVEMTMSPGATPQQIDKLWIEIPLKANEVPLFHEMADSLRINTSGYTPSGNGVVWDSTKAERFGGVLTFTEEQIIDAWRNTFVPYIWLGAEERGICWFGENDKGWITEKAGSPLPLQDIYRDGDRVVLRVYLVNTPAVISAPHKLVFGLQASPTKPMPVDWRARARYMPGGSGPVNPWGGISCACKFPYKDDWSVVDKIIEAQKTGNFDEAWFKDWIAKNDPPKVYGTQDYLAMAKQFAGFKQRPVVTYHEEMFASPLRPEFQTFQDDWGLLPYTYRKWPDESEMRKGKDFSPEGGGHYSRSYQDYGVWYANEWLKRGIGLYWDNTFPKVSGNTIHSAAYVSEDGHIQPALMLWSQREYQQRIWNLYQYWKTHQTEPIEWVNHMTNTLILPIHTYSTILLDYELNTWLPYPPERHRAEGMGRQVGSYSFWLDTPMGNNQYVQAAMERIEPGVTTDRDWGMRMVHESLRGWYPGGDSFTRCPLEKIVYDYGYGTPAVTVHNYWAEKPVAGVDYDRIKWIVMAKPAEKDLLIVLSSWSPLTSRTLLKFDPKALGFTPGKTATDMVTGEALPVKADGSMSVTLSAPFGVRLIRVKQ